MVDPTTIIQRFKQLKGNVAYDIGSDVGDISKILSYNFNVLFSFEPAEESFAILRRLADEYQNMIPLPLAVLDKTAEIELTISAESIKKGQLVSGKYLDNWGKKIGVRKVRSTTIDDFLKDYSPPDFVKIDVEGHELEVVRGGIECFRTADPELFVEVHSKYLGTSIRDILAPFYDFEVILHPAYSEMSPRKQNNYFMFSHPNEATR